MGNIVYLPMIIISNTCHLHYMMYLCVKNAFLHYLSFKSVWLLIMRLLVQPQHVYILPLCTKHKQHPIQQHQTREPCNILPISHSLLNLWGWKCFLPPSKNIMYSHWGPNDKTWLLLSAQCISITGSLLTMKRSWTYNSGLLFGTSTIILSFKTHRL